MKLQAFNSSYFCSKVYSEDDGMVLNIIYCLSEFIDTLNIW